MAFFIVTAVKTTNLIHSGKEFERDDLFFGEGQWELVHEHFNNAYID
jgi:hypothetical protein